GWTNGIIVRRSEIKSGVLFFVNTLHGVVVMYPRVHERDRGLTLGSYLRVNTEPSRSRIDKCQNEEVQNFEWNERPVDHEVEIRWSKVNVKCNAKFVGTEKGWYIFNNAYLGRLAMRENGRLNDRNLKVDRLYRALCRISNNEDGLASIRDPIHWVIEDMDYADRHLHTGRWFEGVVTRCGDQFLILTSPRLPEDVFLYDWQRGRGENIKPQSMLGKWSRFKVAIPRSNDHGLRYRAMSDIEWIDALYETRVINGYTELLIECGWNGEMEDERALLSSDIGLIRDWNGIIDTRKEESMGEYRFWVITHYRQNHTARWKLSIYDNLPTKVNSHPRKKEDDRLEMRSENDSQGPSKKKDGRVINLMIRLMKDQSLCHSLRDNDRESAMRIQEIVERYIQK
ncbi:hypothetical protein PMAYCL1PPCAC_18587, partial [Pristionchus mayeri]